MTRTKQTRPGAHAFTLIELLVVVAIIGLLLSVLFPALARAREASRIAICMSNMRQIAVAATLYAGDFKDSVWDRNQWARLPDYNGTQPGHLYRYTSVQDRIGECPTNRRSGGRHGVGDNMFGTGTLLDFDYTMVSASSGVRTDTTTVVGFFTRPERYAVGVVPPIEASSLELTRMRGIPIFAEESVYFYNESIKDGLWSNMDQFTDRHMDRGHVVYLSGDVELLNFPRGTQPAVQEPRDLDTNDFYALGRGNRWWRMQPDGGSWALRPFGWMNAPRP